MARDVLCAWLYTGRRDERQGRRIKQAEARETGEMRRQQRESRRQHKRGK
jgi:hypothetical protein